MSDSLSLLPVITQTVSVALFLYTAYWAFAIRRVLAVPLFRKQALCVGIVGTYFAVTFSYAGIGGVYNTTNAVTNFIGSLLFFLGFIMIFAWVDVTVRIARKTDPLRRDTFRWRRIRSIVWAMLVIVPSSVFGLSLPSWRLTSHLPGILLLPVLVTIVAIMLTTGPALLLSGSRSKDSTLRTHLKWFGLFVLSLFTAVVGGFSLYLIHAQVIPIVGFIVGYTPFIFAAYCLYRGARSLVPLAHLPLPDLSHRRGVQ